jgi:outer membrane lipoprotein SlyB
MENDAPSRVVGVFEDQTHAIDAVRALITDGFSADQIVLVAQSWREQELAQLGIKLQHAGAHGAVTGAAVGGGIGAAAGAALLLIPGVGPVALAVVAIATALGASAGSIVGPFIAMEMTETEAREHAEHVSRGRTVVLVRTIDRAREAQSIMVDHGSYDFSMSTD